MSPTKKKGELAPCLIPLPSAKVDISAENWVFQWQTEAPEGGFRIEINGLREHAEDAYSEISIVYERNGVSRKIHGPAKLNLMAYRSRKELANDLTDRYPKYTWTPPHDYMPNNQAMNVPHDVSIRWMELIDTACNDVIRFTREGNPTLDLAQAIQVSGNVDYLIEGMIPLNHTTAIYSDGGAGKSWILEWLLALIAYGYHRPPFKPLTSKRVLYLDYEVDEAEAKRRLLWIANGINDPALTADGLQGDTFFYRRMERPLVDDLQRIRQEIARLGIGVVGVDSIGPATGGDILKAEGPIRTMNAIRSLGDDVTKIVVAHISKAEAREDGKSTMYGNAFFGNLARATFELKRNEDRSNYERVEAALIHQKANIGRHLDPIAFTYAWDDANKIFRVEKADLLNTPGLARHEGTGALIESILRNGYATAKEIQESISDAGGKASLPTIRKYCERMSAKIGKVNVKAGTPGRIPDTYYLLDRAAEYTDLFGDEGG